MVYNLKNRHFIPSGKADSASSQQPLSRMTCLYVPQVVSEVMSRDLKMEVDDELLQAAKH